MALLASDMNNPEFAGASNPDAALAVKFHVKPVKNNIRSESEGRPIFEDVIFCEICTPGNALNIIDVPAREDHKQRFPLHWAHFKNTQGGDAREIGTPLSQWPLLSVSQVEELRALKFFTVESIANASDQQIGNIGMAGGMAPVSFRQRAKNFLMAAKDESALAKQAEEVARLKAEQEAKDARHAEQMEEMRKQIEELSAAVNIPKRGPGRPKEQIAA